MTGETERTNPNQELRQGDMLRIEDDRGPATVPTLGVIINADCDLVNGKTDGTIAYLPVYRFRKYLERFWIPTYIAQIKEALLKDVRATCGLNDKSSDDLLRWLAHAEPSAIVQRLAVDLQLKQKAEDELLSRLVKLRSCIDPALSPFEVFAQMCRKEKDPERYARRQLADAKKAMGDGHFFISEVVGEPDVGFVVRMRRIFTIDAGRCFASTAAQRISPDGGGVTAVRFARLTPLYKFRVAQLFAHQFTRIGLPDDITALSELALDDVVSMLVKEST